MKVKAWHVVLFGFFLPLLSLLSISCKNKSLELSDENKSPALPAPPLPQAELIHECQALLEKGLAEVKAAQLEPEDKQKSTALLASAIKSFESCPLLGEFEKERGMRPAVLTEVEEIQARLWLEIGKSLLSSQALSEERDGHLPAKAREALSEALEISSLRKDELEKEVLKVLLESFSYGNGSWRMLYGFTEDGDYLVIQRIFGCCRDELFSLQAELYSKDGKLQTRVAFVLDEKLEAQDLAEEISDELERRAELQDSPKETFVCKGKEETFSTAHATSPLSLSCKDLAQDLLSLTRAFQLKSPERKGFLKEGKNGFSLYEDGPSLLNIEGSKEPGVKVGVRAFQHPQSPSLFLMVHEVSEGFHDDGIFESTYFESMEKERLLSLEKYEAAKNEPDKEKRLAIFKDILKEDPNLLPVHDEWLNILKNELNLPWEEAKNRLPPEFSKEKELWGTVLADSPLANGFSLWEEPEAEAYFEKLASEVIQNLPSQKPEQR